MEAGHDTATMRDTTIVTCIEAGGLEDQVVLLASSLRRLGGRQAQTPIIAVKARSGPPLRASTRRALGELGVRILDRRLNVRNAWWPHANKPAALSWADHEVRTPWITWMDSDMLVLREPDAFTPPPGFDFIARPGEAFDVASGGDDEKAPFWRAVCAQQGLDFDRFPTITSFPDGRAIKAYWQAGIFTFRRDTGFADTYWRVMDDLLAGAVGSKFAGIYHTDQVALAIAVQAAQVTTAEYAPTMNLNLNNKDPETFGRYPLEAVKIVHYHGSFWPENVAWAASRLTGLDRDQQAVLDEVVPLSAGGALLRLHRRAYEMARAKPLKAYTTRVRLI